jgi:predicted component of type VI protein secretion system
MVEHPISLKGNEIQVKQHFCHPESIISYNETLLDNEKTVWIGLLAATKALDMNKLKSMVPDEYHKCMDLFGELLVQVLPPHQTFNHQI